MQKIFITFLLAFSLVSYGQQANFKPFKLIVLKPDTAVIDKMLYTEVDSVQKDYTSMHAYSIKVMEQISNSDFPPDSLFNELKKAASEALDSLKLLNPDTTDFKYYHIISSYSTKMYKYYFNAPQYSTVIEMPNQKIDLTSIVKLATILNADFVVYFTNIHTEKKNGSPFLKLTTSLYSKQENRIILTKETVGDSINRGDLWFCGDIKLSCLLINAVRTSTDEVANEIINHLIKN